MKTRRSKATDIPQRVKMEVWQRDNRRCIICGSKIASPNAHFISRAKGGLGIPENIVTLCTINSDGKRGCHDRYDNGSAEDREEIGGKIEAYLSGIYPEWDKSKLLYDKWRY